jgi:hypothetical protein
MEILCTLPNIYEMMVPCILSQFKDVNFGRNLAIVELSGSNGSLVSYRTYSTPVIPYLSRPMFCLYSLLFKILNDI